MTGNRIALDTNQVITLLNDADNSRQWIQMFQEVFLPVPVIAELYYGALNSRHVADNLHRIADFVSRCALLEANESVARSYAEIRLALKQKGKPIPENDLWIAAICVDSRLPLASSDIHFSEIEALELVRR